jgi:hypothetical protein
MEADMENRSSRFKFLRLAASLGILLGGCAPSVQIVRAPFISPMVLPSANAANSGEFTLIAAVNNYGSTTSPDLWLGIYSEYWPNCTADWCSGWPQVIPNPQTTGPPSSQSDCLHVGVLAPNVGWAVTDYTIDHGTRQCMQGSCPGHVWLTLTVDPACRQRFAGPNTGLHVNWAESGALASEIIREF